MTGMMNQPQIRQIISAPNILGNHMMHVQFFAIFQMLMADWTDTLLSLDKLSVTKHRHLKPGSSLPPVIL
jgi:hypothetical protein